MEIQFFNEEETNGREIFSIKSQYVPRVGDFIHIDSLPYKVTQVIICYYSAGVQYSRVIVWLKYIGK